ncbi:hypothetical protein [Parvibacter caecicola]|uniref:Uncharacterized protein n=1 Tax=Parvibacter caecicola TaxID=747645 RepID=A0A4T9TCF6_9ACTN|nr:hypothetical protein [Parvibacter caecicola]TJW09709.1 hypothetical protein E5982_08650 [Parvibacter caecicola]
METASMPAPRDTAVGGLSPESADVASAPEADTCAEATFEEAVAALTETVNRAPLHREIFLKLLTFCTTQRTLAEAEEAVRACSEFPSVAQSPYRLVRTLVHAGGLYWLELDETGRPLTSQAKAGLTPDEIEDATFAYAVVTTPVGEQVAEDLAPEKRLRRLFDLVPQRLTTYLDLMDFCREKRTFKEIEALLRTRPAAAFANTTSSQPLQPSFFVDALERSGGLAWNDGWKITERGMKVLQQLR